MTHGIKKIIALDGHDGSGKTTLAKLLADETGGRYLRPFGGEAGVELLNYAEKKEYNKLSLFGITQINKVISGYSNELLICDRHWLTVFSLLPEEYWDDSAWLPLPPTVLCFAGLDTTLARLGERKEEEYDLDYHSYYLEVYLKLGKKFNTELLRTDQYNTGESLSQLIHWYNSI